jgi:hypothetical protein
MRLHYHARTADLWTRAGEQVMLSSRRLRRTQALEHLAGIHLPAALRELLCLYDYEGLCERTNGNDLYFGITSLLQIENFIVDGHLRVIRENQDCAAWYIPLNAGDNPPVFVCLDWPIIQRNSWQVAASLSDFMFEWAWDGRHFYRNVPSASFLCPTPIDPLYAYLSAQFCMVNGSYTDHHLQQWQHLIERYEDVRAGRFVRISGPAQNRTFWFSARTNEAFAEIVEQLGRVDGVFAQINSVPRIPPHDLPF